MDIPNKSKFAGQPVLIRIDLNLPLTKTGEIISGGAHSRLALALPEIKFWLELGSPITLITHWGKPNQPNRQLSTARLAPLLATALNHPVRFIAEPITTTSTTTSVTKSTSGEIRLLENLRFSPGETANDLAFATTLIQGQSFYVNNAFSVSHRNHASIALIPTLLPSFLGQLTLAEVDALKSAPDHSLVVVGGNQLLPKLPALIALASHQSRLFLAGNLCLPMLANRGLGITPEFQSSKAEALAASQLVGAWGNRLILPTDFVTLEASGEILDIGPESIAIIKSLIDQHRSVIWNGPLGQVENLSGQASTIAIGKHLNNHPVSYATIGGGSTTTLLDNNDLFKNITHVSSGGGAMLMYLSGAFLPGLAPFNL